MDPHFFIAAPFGNYIHHPNAISVHGTFTLFPQGNRFTAVITSLRHSKEGWTNRLGLPNPGLEKGLKNLSHKNILSITEVNRNEFQEMNRIIPKNSSLELNLSCPNVKYLPWDHIRQFPNKDREWCIAKMSPLSTPEEIEYVLKQGFRQFHFSNTLPHRKGGLSGKSLIPYTNRLISIIRTDFQNYGDIVVIAGGGVTTHDDIRNYLDEGANHISIGSAWLSHPLKTYKLLKKEKI